jgi:hypothetical protein
MKVSAMNMSELISWLDEDDEEEMLASTSFPGITLPFLPGSEYQGAVPTDTVTGRYEGEVPVGTSRLRLDVYECDQRLWLTLKSWTPAWANHVVWMTVHGDRGEVATVKLTLRREGSAEYRATTNLGPVADIQAKLGDDLRWTVFPPREITESLEDQAPAPAPASSAVDELIRYIQDALRKLPETIHAIVWRRITETFGTKSTGVSAPARELDRVDILENKYGYLLHRYHALRATIEVLRAAATEASGFAIQRLKELAAERRHFFWAPVAWIFVKEKDVLRAVVRRRTMDSASELPVDEKSISGFVAKHGKAYYTNNPQGDEKWRDTVPATASMAAPINAFSGDVIGVICLETFHSTERFSKPLLDALVAGTAGLVPHIHVLQSLGRTDASWCSWHPRLHKWDFALLLRRICHAIAEAIEDKIAADSIDCAIWLVDRSNCELWMYASSGYGIEYIKEETHPFGSFTGCVADCSAGTVGQANPGQNRPSTLWTFTADGKWKSQDGHPFLYVPKHKVTGLTEATATPIHLVDSSGKAGEAAYVLAFYAYDKAGQKLLTSLSREEQIELAKLLGELMSAYLKQRENLALAYFAEMFATPRDARDCAPIIREFTELFKLSEAKVYLRSGPYAELMAVEKHGLVRELDADDGNCEYLNALLARPGIPVRINSDNEHARRPDAMMRDVAGWLPWNDPDHRRFLDIGIEGVGVIRLIRSGTSKPFTPDDERLFVRLAALCGNFLRDWGLVPNGHRNVGAYI